MELIYQTEENNRLQTALASLLEFPIEEVPNFNKYKDSWSKFMYFVNHAGYAFDGSLYNSRCVSNKIEKAQFVSLFGHRGIKGYFIALVDSPKNGLHPVIIDKTFKIVNPINKEYEGIKFPNADKCKYNGIKQILLIRKKDEV